MVPVRLLILGRQPDMCQGSARQWIPLLRMLTGVCLFLWISCSCVMSQRSSFTFSLYQRSPEHTWASQPWAYTLKLLIFQMVIFYRFPTFFSSRWTRGVYNSLGLWIRVLLCFFSPPLIVIPLKSTLIYCVSIIICLPAPSLLEGKCRPVSELVCVPHLVFFLQVRYGSPERREKRFWPHWFILFFSYVKTWKSFARIIFLSFF